MKKMKGTVYLLAMVALACLTLQVPAIEAAPSINLFDYFFCRGIGDSWTYKYTEYVTPPVVPLFTVTTFLINSGEYEGKIYWGDFVKPDGKTSHSIISLAPEPLLCELDKIMDNPFDPTTGAWYFRKLDKLSVPAGNFKDILLKIDLDKRFGPNSGNSIFKLPTSIPYGVTHVQWLARKVGILKDMDFNEIGPTGYTYELISRRGRNVVPSVAVLLGE